MRSTKKILVGIPVYNEASYINKVLSEVCKYADDVLVVDDGSNDLTPALLAGHPVEVIRHSENRGYGRSLQDMFRWATVDQYDWLITMDCDEQHEPAAIPRFVEAIMEDKSDIISGSRYAQLHPENDMPPEDRQAINKQITSELNCALGYALTDAFCGFKAYRVSALTELDFDVDGYEFPLQLWVQAAVRQLKIEEIPVRLIYNDPTRTFGGPLDDPKERIGHYREVLYRELSRYETQLLHAKEHLPC